MSNLDNVEKSLPFHSLDDLDYQFTVVNNEKFSLRDMDRLSQLKYNPFQKNNNIALSGNSENLDKSFNMNKISCDYYLVPNEFKKQTIKNTHTNQITSQLSWSLLDLNIRSISIKFDSFKHLLDSLNKPFQVISLTET